MLILKLLYDTCCIKKVKFQAIFSIEIKFIKIDRLEVIYFKLKFKSLFLLC